MAPHLVRISQSLVRASNVGGARIAISLPPRHGKSFLVSHHFPAWYLGVYPDRRFILTSYEADFAASWGRKARGLLEEHGGLFGVSVSASSSAADRWDIEGRDGGMVTAGVGGPITGKGANLLLVDDPIKNYEEAHSETYRERAWNWLTSTAYTRLEPDGSLVLVATRWHEDDMIGMALRELTHENWEEIRFPALAEKDDALGRQVGAALWPERFNVEQLEKIKKTLGSYQFAALYQQRPTPEEGGMFKREWFQTVEAAPIAGARMRSWDKAGTDGAGDFSAGPRVSKSPDGIFYIEDMVRGQWAAHARETIIHQTAVADAGDCPVYTISLQQDPGQAGKADIEYSIKRLAGFHVVAAPVTGEKAVRARPFASQAEAGNVKLVRGAWNKAFLDEVAMFPNGAHDDQVDAVSDAINRLVGNRKPQFF